MRNRDIQLPSHMTGSRGLNDVKIYISVSFTSLILSLHLSALVSSVLDLLSDRLSALVGKDGQQQFQSQLKCSLLQEYMPIQEPITVARRMEYADWPGSPKEPGVGELIREPYR